MYLLTNNNQMNKVTNWWGCTDLTLVNPGVTSLKFKRNPFTAKIQQNFLHWYICIIK